MIKILKKKEYGRKTGGKTARAVLPLLLLTSVTIGIFSPVSANLNGLSRLETTGITGFNVANAQTPAPNAFDAQQKMISAMKSASDSDCGLFNFPGCVDVVYRLLGNFILTIFSLFVWVGGMILDGGMWVTVNMKLILDSVPIVDTGWKVFRDLANMLFIFILIYIAISTILGLGETKRMLVNVIITALLINFSLFFTKIVVDTSNLVALQFYDRINIAANAIEGSGTNSSIFKGGPSVLFMNGLKLQTTFSPEALKGGFTTPVDKQLADSVAILKDGAKFLVMVIFGAIIMLIAGFIFAVGGILLLIRVVVLMFLMMIAPLAFISRILPSMNSGWKKWSEALVNNAIWAPAYMALTYVVATVAQKGFTSVTALSGGSFANVFSGVGSAFGLVINYILLIIIMIMTILISKQFGVYGANAVIGWGEKVASGTRRWTQDKMKWGVGAAFTGTVGRLARRYEEKAAVSGGKGLFAPNRWIMSHVRAATTKPWSEKKVLGSISAVERYKAEKDRKDKLRDSITVSLVDEAGLAMREKHDLLKATEEKIAAWERVENLEEGPGLTDEEKAKKAELEELAKSQQEEVKNKEEDLQNALMKLSPAGASKIATRDYAKMPEVVSYMSTTQYQAIMNSDKTQEDKDKITEYRFGRHTKAVEKYVAAMSESYNQLQIALDDVQDLTSKVNAEKDDAKKALLQKELDKKEARAEEIGNIVNKGDYYLLDSRWSKRESEEFEALREDLRGKPTREMEQLNRVRPDLINGYMTGFANWWQVKEWRKSEGFNYTQREGKGNSARDWKEASLNNAFDILFNVKMKDKKTGEHISMEDRFDERERKSRVWQKVLEKGEDKINDVNDNTFSKSEREDWEKMKKVPESQKKLALKLIDSHHKNRSPEELINPGGRVRNVPVNVSTFDAPVLKPAMGKDIRHHKNWMMQNLRNFIDGKLTEQSKSFLGKALFDRDGKDFYPAWQTLADEMGIGNHPMIEKLKKWAEQEAEGKKEFNKEENVPTVSLYETLPGVKPSGGSSGITAGTGDGGAGGGTIAGGGKIWPKGKGPNSGGYGQGGGGGEGGPQNPKPPKPPTSGAWDRSDEEKTREYNVEPNELSSHISSLSEEIKSLSNAVEMFGSLQGPLRQTFDELRDRFDGLQMELRKERTGAQPSQGKLKEIKSDLSEVADKVDELKRAQSTTVPDTVTNAMRQALQELNYSPEQINQMKPEDAWNILKHRTK